MNSARDFDAITVEQLRAQGSTKWTTYPDVLGAFVAEMDFGIAPEIASALMSAITEGRTGYLSDALKADFQRAFAEFANRRYHWKLRPEQVRPVPDVLSGVEAAVRYLLPEGPVVLPTPAYMPFRPLLDQLGRRVIEVPMVRDRSLRTGRERWVNDWAGIDAAFKSGARWFMLVNPHNPTGRVFERAELETLAQIVERHRARVFADEIHAPLVYPHRASASRFPTIGRRTRHLPYASLSAETAVHTITAASASKAWNLPGLKAAQLIITGDDDLARWEELGGWTEHLTSTLGVIAQIAAYDDGGPWLDGVLDYLAGNRKWVTTFVGGKLPRVGFIPPEGTYLCWLDLRDYELSAPDGTPQRPAAWLREHAGVALTEGHECGEAGDGFARLNLATPRPILRRELRQIAKALNSSDG